VTTGAGGIYLLLGYGCHLHNCTLKQLIRWSSDYKALSGTWTPPIGEEPKEGNSQQREASSSAHSRSEGLIVLRSTRLVAKCTITQNSRIKCISDITVSPFDIRKLFWIEMSIWYFSFSTRHRFLLKGQGSQYHYDILWHGNWTVQWITCVTLVPIGNLLLIDESEISKNSADCTLTYNC
jgi:hypothetical protein